MIDWPNISRRYAPLIWRTAYRLVGNDADAADCLQETFLSALRYSQKQEIRNWPAMLQHLVTARALDCLRRRSSANGQAGLSTDWEQLPASGISPEQRVEDAELVNSIRSALARLPAHQSEVFCLRYLNDMSCEEISQELSISTDAVGMALHRARARLRELLVSTSSDAREAR